MQTNEKFGLPQARDPLLCILRSAPGLPAYRLEANLVEAIEIITEYKLTGLTVTGEAGEVVGILSELDCIKGVLTAVYNEGDPEHSLVRDAMCTASSSGRS